MLLVQVQQEGGGACGRRTENGSLVPWGSLSWSSPLLNAQAGLCPLLRAGLGAGGQGWGQEGREQGWEQEGEANVLLGGQEVQRGLQGDSRGL